MWVRELIITIKGIDSSDKIAFAVYLLEVSKRCGYRTVYIYYSHYDVRGIF